jgi:hypothetical protein
MVQSTRRRREGCEAGLAHVMTYGTLTDITTTLQYFSEKDFEAVLNDPPPGVFDRRSWTYWNVRYHRKPVPELPKRQIPR